MIQMHKTTLTFALALLLCFLASNEVLAQSGTWKFGFELGWTQSKLTGELEKDDSGTDLESLKFNGGFHLSFYARRHFTDEMGVQFGLSYAQRGVKQEFEGPSYYIFWTRKHAESTLSCEPISIVKNTEWLPRHSRHCLL